MEFNEMQIIWNNQNEEKLFAINETAMYDKIKRKGKSITRKVNFVEWMMIAMNTILAIFLAVDAIQDNEQAYFYILPVMYFAYSVIGLFRRLKRQKGDVRFEPTLVGELDKAIWQINYLIKESQSMMIWYLMPLMLVAMGTLLIKSKSITIFTLIILLVIPLSYIGGKWEVNKFYKPKKKELEAFRDLLLAPEPKNKD
jgi:hypothetical protein